jgi:hypothetical protein
MEEDERPESSPAPVSEDMMTRVGKRIGEAARRNPVTISVSCNGAVMSDEDIELLVKKLGPAVTRALGDDGGCGVRPRIT